MNDFAKLITPSGGQTSYVFFSGKGGVGKTSLSAATAVWLAERGHRTLILSTDLQRSLDDVFRQRLEDHPTPLAGHANLLGVTIDPLRSMEKYRGKILETLELVDPDSMMLKQMRADAIGDCGCAQAALFEFMEYLRSSEFDAVVFDTAPLGAHLEKLAAQNRYAASLTEQAASKARLAEVLGDEGLRRRAEALHAIERRDAEAVENLRSARSRYVLIMIPENLPYREVERNLTVLEGEHRVPVRAVVINQIIPAEERVRSPFFRRRAEMQERFIRLAHERFRPRALASVPLLGTETVGFDPLRKIGAELLDREAA